MARVIITYVRDDITKPWIIVTPETTHDGTFTTEELNILIATWSAVQSYPGYVSSTNEFIDEYTCKGTIVFDTLQNAENARELLINPPINSALHLRKELMIKKRKEVIGKDYTITIDVVE